LLLLTAFCRVLGVGVSFLFIIDSCGIKQKKVANPEISFSSAGAAVTELSTQ